MFEAHRTITALEEVEVPAGLDNLPSAPGAEEETRRDPGFQLPASLWSALLACYVVFFAGIVFGTAGSGKAIMAIAISALYAAMFFGLARVMARQAGPEPRSPLAQGRPLDTWCGPMSPAAVYGQILSVPIALAFFGLAIGVIAHAVG